MKRFHWCPAYDSFWRLSRRLNDSRHFEFMQKQGRFAVDANLDDVWPKQPRGDPIDHDDAVRRLAARHLHQVTGVPD